MIITSLAHLYRHKWKWVLSPGHPHSQELGPYSNWISDSKASVSNAVQHVLMIWDPYSDPRLLLSAVNSVSFVWLVFFLDGIYSWWSQVEKTVTEVEVLQGRVNGRRPLAWSRWAGPAVAAPLLCPRGSCAQSGSLQVEVTAAASFGAETPTHVAFQIQSLRWKANVLWNQPHFHYHNNLVIPILAWLTASEGDVQQSFRTTEMGSHLIPVRHIDR